MQPSEPEAQRMLRNSDLLARARTVLDELAAPRVWVYAVSCAVTAAAVGYVAERSGLQSAAQALIVGLATGLVYIAIDHWSLRRRLDAAIVLLKSGTPQVLPSISGATPNPSVKGTGPRPAPNVER